MINVIAGDMTIVGPRPDVPAQSESYSEGLWIESHSVRPGITGLAQSTFLSNATPEHCTKLNMYYVRKASLRLDTKFWLMTLRLCQIIGKGGN